MMHLAEYRKQPARLADYLPWAGLVAPGVVLNKDGSFQRTLRFRGPDLDSVAESELQGAHARINNALKRLGDHWAIFVEAARRPSSTYPTSSFPEPLSWLVDEERRAGFEEAGAHFESTYYLTLLFQPPAERETRAARLLFDEPKGTLDSDEGSPESPVAMHRGAGQWRMHLETFLTETDRLIALLREAMAELEVLGDAQVLTYLHSTISSSPHPISVPEATMHLDELLVDQPMVGGLNPQLGNEHLRLVTVRGFPGTTWPGLLDELNRLGIAYRWVTRFVCLDKVRAEREIGKVRRQWFAKRKSIATLLRETIFQQESPLVDSDAANKATDADAALQEVGSDAVSFGYITITVVVSDPDAVKADEKKKAIERTIQSRGFVAIGETLNAVEAWLSSLPGQVYANVRRALVSTLNLTHLLPLSAVWAGPLENAHLHGAPLIVCRTDGATPFRLITHIGDVGHTLIVGPTGAGKSVLLAMVALQFRRYPGARIFAFDKDRSLRATVLGLGGQHYSLSAAGDVAFQPLAGIDDSSVRAWAAEWIEGILAAERIEITPDVKALAWSALASLASAPPVERTLTGLTVLIQSKAIRQALAPYTLSGAHGRLLDAERDSLKLCDIQCFEMAELMHTRGAVLPVLTYLLQQLESRFDGAPTLLLLDEAWHFLDHSYFAGRIREWLKTLRKKNVSVIFSTPSLTDIQDSPIALALAESCPTRIFLPSAHVVEPQLRPIYQSFGLNDRQLALLAQAVPKREYYYQSRLGHRLFELGLGPIALAFAGASRPEDQRVIDRLLFEERISPSTFAAAWLRHKDLPWAADLLANHPLHSTLHIKE